MVVLRHSFNALAMPMETRLALLHSPFAVFLNGQGAVQVFFVLSGYVLAGSLRDRLDARSIAAFYVKRWWRIQPPFIAALALAWAGSRLDLSLSEAVTPLTQRFATVDVPIAALVPWALIPGEALGLFPVGWTLRVEMLFSALFPILLLVARAHPALLLALGAALVLAGGDLAHGFAFSLGIYLHRARVRAGAFPLAPRWVLAVAALGLVTLPVVAGEEGIIGGVVVSGFRAWEIACMALGASGLVLIALDRAVLGGLLSSPICRWLGRVSYSVYLVHFTVILVAQTTLVTPVGWMQAAAFIAVVLAVTLGLGALGYRWVERPAIAAGATLAHRLTRATSEHTVRTAA